MPHNTKIHEAIQTRDTESFFWEMVKKHLDDVLKRNLKERIKLRGAFIGGMAESLGRTIKTPSEMRAYRQKGCSICGYDTYEAIVIHHIDRNRDNNATHNLIPVCRNCHQLIHRGLIEINPKGVEITKGEVNVEYQLNRLNPPKKQ